MNKATLQIAAFDAIDDPMLIIGADGVIEGANSVYFERYSRTISDVFKDDAWLLFRRALRKTLDSGLLKIIIATTNLEGVTNYTNLVIKKRVVNDQDILFLQFKEHNDPLWHLMQTTASPFCIVDNEGIYHFVNDAFAQFVDPKLTASQLIGKEVGDYSMGGSTELQSRWVQMKDQVKATNSGNSHVMMQSEGYNSKGEVSHYFVVSDHIMLKDEKVSCFFFLDQGGSFIADLESKKFRQMLQSIIDTIREPIYLKDEHGKIILANNIYAKQFNKMPEELRGLSSYDLQPTIAASLDGLEQMLLKDPYTNNIAPFYDADGEPVGMAQYQVSPCQFAEGQYGLIALVHDITQEREREEALVDARRYLEDERSFLQQIIDSLPVPLYVKDINGRFLKSNINFAKTFGKTPLEIIGLTTADLNMSSDLNMQLNDFDEHFAENPIADSSEMFFVYPNGGQMRARGYYSPTFDPLGNYSGLACIIFDITEEWNLHRQLFDSEERWQFAVKATNDAIWDYHYKDDLFFYYNKLSEILRLPLDSPRKSLDDFQRRVHPDDTEQLNSLIAYFLGENQQGSIIAEVRMMCGDYIYRWMQIKGLTIFDHDNHQPLRAVGVISDISERKSHEEQVIFQSTHDLLTSLPNRVYFHQELDKVLKTSIENSETFAICMLDLDGFKQVNDTLGHQEGDELLKVIAKRIVNVIGPQHFVSRMGGDEFIFILRAIKNDNEALELMNAVLESIRRPILLEHGTADVAGSIGVAFYPQHATDDRMLIRLADIAMYHSKNAGRDQITIWDSSFGN